MIELESGWAELLKDELNSQSWQELMTFLEEQYRLCTIYPPKTEIFAALNGLSFDAVNVVILGQDPYHEENQAHGFCFSVKKGVKIPPSLRNIFKELRADMGINPPCHGNLEAWAEEGVLLLNSILTVRKGAALSHKNKGWEQLTDKIISLLGTRERPLVFMLWGAAAANKRPLITNPEHLVLQSPHPSPLSASRGFFGCKHFSAAADFLKGQGIDIFWELGE